MGRGSIRSCADQEWNTWLRSRLRTADSSRSSARGRTLSSVMALPRPGESEVHARCGRVRPARGDNLAPGVEVDAFRTVHVAVPEQRRLPPAEGVVGDRYRDGDVDA